MFRFYIMSLFMSLCLHANAGISVLNVTYNRSWANIWKSLPYLIATTKVALSTVTMANLQKENWASVLIIFPNLYLVCGSQVLSRRFWVCQSSVIYFPLSFLDICFHKFPGFLSLPLPLSLLLTQNNSALSFNLLSIAT